MARIKAGKAISTKAHAKIKSIGDDLLAEVDRRLISGEAASAIGTWLQVDLGKLTLEQPATVKKMLERYRATELRDKTLARIAGAQEGDSTVTVGARLNAMAAMEEMVLVQLGRVKKLITHEENLPGGITNKSINGEMRLWKDMMNDLGRLQLETGVLARATKTVKGSYTDSETGETRQFEWSEQQDALFAELDGAMRGVRQEPS